MARPEPGYLRLYESGELQRRVDTALADLASCEVCPWGCGVDRLAGGQKVCRTARHARVTSCFPHMGEEDCLRGWRGSGTIFFGWCNLRCVFCQNFDISQGEAGYEVTPEQLAEMMLQLQARGCHNINWVTPEHVVPQALEALPIAVRDGLRLPIVYNTSALDSIDSLRLMDGIVDVYMPDFKYWSPDASRQYLGTPDYPAAAREAFREMHRQVGDLKTDSRGLAVRGLLVRHLVMPDGLDETREIVRFLAGLSRDTYVNIMAQYHPAGRVDGSRCAELNRRIRADELAAAYGAAREAGLHRFDER